MSFWNATTRIATWFSRAIIFRNLSSYTSSITSASSEAGCAVAVAVDAAAATAFFRFPNRNLRSFSSRYTPSEQNSTRSRSVETSCANSTSKSRVNWQYSRFCRATNFSHAAHLQRLPLMRTLEEM